MKRSLLPKLTLCCCLLFSFLNAKLQTISTVAGNGSKAYSGDSGLAVNAEIGTPIDVDFDGANNMYITDNAHSVLRKVNLLSGIITTVAGNSTAGYNGDSIPATQAELNNPLSAAADAAGNIYIADNNNYRIRRVDALTGIITTIAGDGTNAFAGDSGLAINAELNDPRGVALDPLATNLYITEGGNRIRKINLLTGIITTIAGTGINGFNGDGIPAVNAWINSPFAITIDAANNVYFSDWLNNRIRKIDASSGIIYTIAGNGNTGHSGDGGVAINAEIGYCWGIALDGSNDVFISDWQFNYVRKINLNDSTISTVAGTGAFGYNGDSILATQANLGSPDGIALDAQGNFYIAENGYALVRKVMQNIVLPLKLIAFEATHDNETNRLTWSTSNEINTKSFEIERSSNSRSFTSIGSVNAFGNNKLTNNYAFTDVQPLKGINYYRLKAMDKDGKFIYSAIRSINNANNFDAVIYPNPVKNNLVLNFNSANNTDIQIQIVAADGRVVLQKKLQIIQGVSRQTINTSDLQAGNYFVRCINAEGKLVLSFIKQ